MERQHFRKTLSKPVDLFHGIAGPIIQFRQTRTLPLRPCSLPKAKEGGDGQKYGQLPEALRVVENGCRAQYGAEAEQEIPADGSGTGCSTSGARCGAHVTAGSGFAGAFSANAFATYDTNCHRIRLRMNVAFQFPPVLPSSAPSGKVRAQALSKLRSVISGKGNRTDQTNFNPRILRMATNAAPRVEIFLKLLPGCRVFLSSGASGSPKTKA